MCLRLGWIRERFFAFSQYGPFVWQEQRFYWGKRNKRLQNNSLSLCFFKLYKHGNIPANAIFSFRLISVFIERSAFWICRKFSQKRFSGLDLLHTYAWLMSCSIRLLSMCRDFDVLGVVMYGVQTYIYFQPVGYSHIQKSQGTD